MTDSYENDFHHLQQSINRISDECLQLRLWCRALMYSHPQPTAFAAAVEKEREAALAIALPSAVDERSIAAIEAAAETGLAIARRFQARGPGQE